MRRASAIALSALVWLVGVPRAHGVLPWLLSLVGPRFVSRWNQLGLVPLAFGVALLVSIAVTSLSRLPDLPETLELNWTPKLFISSGPYAYSRNPMYVAELALWLGWAILLGSLTVLGSAAILGWAMTRIVPREERALEASYGDSYRRYRDAVPRWLGRVRSQ